MKVRPAKEARESGYYWVLSGHEWYIAEWFKEDSRWYICSVAGERFSDDEFGAIDERRIKRVVG